MRFGPMSMRMPIAAAATAAVAAAVAYAVFCVESNPCSKTIVKKRYKQQVAQKKLRESQLLKQHSQTLFFYSSRKGIVRNLDVIFGGQKRKLNPYRFTCFWVSFGGIVRLKWVSFHKSRPARLIVFIVGYFVNLAIYVYIQ